MKPISSISKGIGALTPRAWARIMRAIGWVERFGKAVDRSLQGSGVLDLIPETSVFPAVITDWETHSIDPLRYRYSWEMLAPLDQTDLMVSAGATDASSHIEPMYRHRVFGTMAGGSNSGYGPAFNVPEWGHSDTDPIPPGFDTSDSQWPGAGTFTMQPIQKRTMVIMYMIPSEVINFSMSSEDPKSATNLVPCFCLSNIVMGNCT